MSEKETGYFEVFHEVGRAVLSVLSVKEVLHLIAKRVVAALGLKASALLLVDEDKGSGLRVAATHLLSRDYVSKEPLEGDPGIEQAMAGSTHLMKNAAEESASEAGALISSEGIGSILSVPLVLRDKVAGVLRLYTYEPREFTEEEQDLIWALAEIGAIAIENARMFEVKSKELSKLLEKGGVDYGYEPPVEKYRVRAIPVGEIPAEKSYIYFNRLHRVARAMATKKEMDRILETAVREIADATELKGCSLLWLNFATQELELVTGCGLSEEYLSKGPLQMDRSIPQALEGEVVNIPDVGSDPRIQYPEAAQKEGIVSILSVPILVKEKVRGVLRLYCDRPRTYPPDEIEFIKALAEMGGIAILNAHLYQAMKNDYAFWTSTLSYLGIEDSKE
ncbi:MAG: GAF domain-containing protein [Desulfobacteraceae bacterium]